MSKRVTLMINDDLYRAITNLQAEMIMKMHKSVSFSSVACAAMERGIKKK